MLVQGFLGIDFGKHYPDLLSSSFDWRISGENPNGRKHEVEGEGILPSSLSFEILYVIMIISGCVFEECVTIVCGKAHKNLGLSLIVVFFFF